MSIVDCIKAKLSSWKSSLLSSMVHVELIKSIIQGSLLYSFQVYAWLVSFLKTLDTWIQNFVLTSDIFKHKLVAMS